MVTFMLFQTRGYYNRLHPCEPSLKKLELRKERHTTRTHTPHTSRLTSSPVHCPSCPCPLPWSSCPQRIPRRISRLVAPRAARGIGWNVPGGISPRTATRRDPACHAMPCHVVHTSCRWKSKLQCKSNIDRLHLRYHVMSCQRFGVCVVWEERGDIHVDYRLAFRSILIGSSID